MEFMVLVCLFIYRSDEVEEIDGAVLSSNTILRGVTGRDLLEELQVTCSSVCFLYFSKLTLQAPTSQNGQIHSNNSIVLVCLTILWGWLLKV